MTLAVMSMSMSIEEAFIAATYNGALTLGCENEVGSIEINKKGKVRKSRIFYFRKLRGKKAKIKN